MRDWPWNKIREWLIAVAAVVAAGGTVGAVWYAQVQIKDERQARHQDQAARTPPRWREHHIADRLRGVQAAARNSA